MSFDFDLLDAAEQDVQHCFQDAKFRGVEHFSDPVHAMKTSRPRARIWFEIKRFFEADRKGAPNTAVHCARDLLLKTMFERLQQDGFVQIDAFLPRTTAHNLCDELKLPVLNTDNTNVELQDSQASQLSSGWIGSKYLKKPRGILSLPSPGANTHERRLAFEVSGLKPDVNMSDLASCEITFGTSGGGLLAFKPGTREEFLRSMKAFIHATADATVSLEALSEAENVEKVHARFCFGDRSGILRTLAT